MEESTTPKTKITVLDYGYLWWNIPFQHEKKTFISKMTTENGSQYMVIFLVLNMVPVLTGGAHNSAEDKIPFAIVHDIFIPTFSN